MPPTRPSFPTRRSRTATTSRAVAPSSACPSRATSSACPPTRSRLLRWYKENPDCIRPRTRYNEVLSFVEGGLRDLSISRTSLKWGVPYPGDEEHVVYVWLDALTNYISALGFGSDDEALYEEVWPATMHLVGKDILRFHCVYWPAFLMSAGLPLPKQIFGHGWWLRDEAKMSKSIGNVVRPDYLIERFGADALRYFLAREMTFGQDANRSRTRPSSSASTPTSPTLLATPHRAPFR